mgnify:CR=1 FL=1
MKIFICEQDPYRAKLIHDILGVYNYKIITVNKHTEFFKEVNSHKPAVIVMNQMFAQNSDTDFLTKMRNNPVTASIPVIYIMNNSQSKEEVTPRFDNLTEFVSEPIKIKNLRHYIDRWTTFRSLYVRH